MGIIETFFSSNSDFCFLAQKTLCYPIFPLNSLYVDDWVPAIRCEQG